MPLRVTIESVNRQLTKEIEVKTCKEVIKLKIEVEVNVGGLSMFIVITRCQRRLDWWI